MTTRLMLIYLINTLLQKLRAYLQLIQKMGMQHLLIIIHSTTYSVQSINQSLTSIKLNFVSTEGTEDITVSLKSKDSRGYDEILIKILKASIPCISSQLTYLCIRMLSSGMFPSRLKFSEIKPTF